MLSSMKEKTVEIINLCQQILIDKTFTYPQPGYQILVWSSGSFSKLLEAYTEGLLTDSNIESIWDIYSR